MGRGDELRQHSCACLGRRGTLEWGREAGQVRGTQTLSSRLSVHSPFPLPWRALIVTARLPHPHSVGCAAAPAGRRAAVSTGRTRMDGSPLSKTSVAIPATGTQSHHTRPCRPMRPSFQTDLGDLCGPAGCSAHRDSARITASPRAAARRLTLPGCVTAGRPRDAPAIWQRRRSSHSPTRGHSVGRVWLPYLQQQKKSRHDHSKRPTKYVQMRLYTHGFLSPLTSAGDSPRRPPTRPPLPASLLQPTASAGNLRGV